LSEVEGYLGDASSSLCSLDFSSGSYSYPSRSAGAI
jgi:hypothetical protein